MISAYSPMSIAAQNPAPAARSGWKRPSDAELKKKLTPLQFEVTRQADTETPFHNEYWDNHQEGIYVDIISGEPLFSSLDKYDSGTGWPSFFQPIAKENITEDTDTAYGMRRTEILCARCDCHLGHVFPDGPRPTGIHYCVNSESLEFTDSSALTSLADPAAP